jgi:(R)-2-hydroxyacyl-CoA dehydratese activating ATPase
MICAGIDGGSRTLKIVLLDSARTGAAAILASAVLDQAVNYNALAAATFDDLLARQNLRRADVSRIIATGYGRNLITFAHSTVTEITCHAVGVRHLVPGAQTVIEIGGQDSKLLRLDPSGAVRDFAMNDRCAAGTGRFLEVVAARLAAPLDQLGDLAARAAAPAPISSTCVVFAESEIIGLLAAGTPREDIIAGVQASLAARVAAMAGPNLADPILFTGGVALVPGMREALEKALQKSVALSPLPQLTGALGAALLAARQ